MPLRLPSRVHRYYDGPMPSRTPSPRRRRTAASLTAAVVAIGGLAVPSAHAAIEVGDENGDVVARFARVTCKVTSVKGGKRFHASAKSGRWSMTLTIYPGDFQGYGKAYDIRYGDDSPVDVDVWPRGGRTFSNSYRRETYETPEGGIKLPVPGRVRFRTSGKRRTLEVGLGAIWNGPTSDEEVAVAGRAACR